MSDDGEPHGTAGRPMLSALLHSQVGEVVVVCARYYGGTKLGTGGLVRAYSSGVQKALDAVTTIIKVERTPARIAVEYPHAEAVERVLLGFDVIVTQRDYADSVVFLARVPVDDRDALTAAIGDATRGAAVIEFV